MNVEKFNKIIEKYNKDYEIEDVSLKRLEQTISNWFNTKHKTFAVNVLRHLQSIILQNNLKMELLQIMATKTLVTKAAEYSFNGDRLFNFRRAQYMFDNKDSKDILIGYTLKHAKSVMDILTGKISADQRILEEKFGDLYNYALLFIALCEEHDE